MTQATEVLIPTSPDDAAAAFGDGAGVTVIGGGTIVVPEITHGRLRPAKALLLAPRRALGSHEGRDEGHDRRGDTGPGARRPGLRRSARVPRTWPTSRSARRAPSAGTCAPARGRTRRAATCRVRCSRSAPRCARPAPAASAASRWPTSSATGEGRLLLDVSFEEPAAGAYATIDYPHTHEYTVLAVSGARAADGTVRLAASGLAGHAQLLVGRPGHGGVRGGARRRRSRVGVVSRADAPRARPACPDPARGGRMNLSVNGTEREIESAPADLSPRRAPRGARDHEPEGRAASRAAAGRARCSSTARPAARA